ncbi:hypothetical protein JOE48_003088 [Methylobacterium sp. PvR107]|nr:hypothetical protein [Methylobacterium sp. PvR107]
MMPYSRVFEAVTRFRERAASTSARVLTGSEVTALSLTSDRCDALRLDAHVPMLARAGWLVWRSAPGIGIGPRIFG